MMSSPVTAWNPMKWNMLISSTISCSLDAPTWQSSYTQSLSSSEERAEKFRAAALLLFAMQERLRRFIISFMIMILIVLAALSLGMVVPNRWVLLVPALTGLLALGALVMAGQDITDTPIPFLIVVSTICMWIGSVARTRQFR